MKPVRSADLDLLARFKQGQKVIAGEHEEIGEVLRTHLHGNVLYLEIRRYGPGEDEVYVPSSAVRGVVGNHVYLNLDMLDLVGAPWHELP